MRVRTSCALAALVLAAGGCGSGGSSSSPTTTASTASRTVASAPSGAGSAYVVRMRRLGITLATSIGIASQSNSTTSPATEAANLVRVQRALTRAAAGLAAITPPPAVRTEHALLLKGVREYTSELNGIIRNVRSGQVAAVRAIPSLRGLHDMKRASDAIVQLGYPIVP